jgi:hypothetical protein
VLRLQRDPEVTVYAIADAQRPSIVNLIIENTGKGTAHDLSFKFDHNMPERAFGIEEATQPPTMTSGPLINGIPSFSPGEKRIITWGQYAGLKKGLGDEAINITSTYYSRPPLRFFHQKHKATSSIDMRSFEGTDASDANWSKKSAYQLEIIAKKIGEISKSIAVSNSGSQHSK